MVASAVVLTCSTAFSADADVEMEVAESQKVTLSVESASLRSVIERLCYRVGVELRGYGATDRTFSGAYRNIALVDLLPRLLREESHVVGVRTEPGPRAVRIAWLEVLGSDSGQPRAVRLTKHERTGGISAVIETFESDRGRVLALLAPVFEAEGEMARDVAIREVVRRLMYDSEAREPLLGATQTDIAHELAEYDDATGVLRSIRRSVTQAEARDHLDEILLQVSLARRAIGKN